MSVKTVSEHLQNVFREGELQEAAVVRNFRITAKDDKDYNTLHYNLDAILAVGTRVRSPRATQFRQWAFRILKEYVVHGYALDERRLREDPVAAESAAEKIRAIRYDEMHLYERVRACVALIASDYDGSSEQVRSFFAKMQDRIHYVACGSTAHEIILTRADGTKAQMGMSTHLGNSKPTLKDARVAKNYLNVDELRAEYRAGDAFFIFAEQMAASGRTMTTTQILAKIDEIFRSYDMPIFPGYKVYKSELVKAHTKEQYDLFKARSAQQKYDNARELPRP